MVRELKSLFFTDTGKDTSVVFIGTLLNVTIGGLFFIVAPRILHPESYGIFSVVLATGLMVANLANFGIDTGILKFLKPDNREENDKILKLALKAYLIIGLVIFVLGLLLAAPLASILSIPQSTILLRISFAGVIFILLTNFFIATLQTKRMFVQASFVNISSNTIRLLILGLGAYFATVDLYFLTALFFFVSIVSVVVGKLFVPLDFLKAKEENLHFKNFFGYNFWIAASLAISSIPFDNYLLIKIAGPIATGLYAAPMKILTTTYQFAGGYSRVLASRFSSFDSDKKAIEFARKASGLVIVIFCALILSNFLAPTLITLFGKEFHQSIAVFRILTVGMAFFFADTVPMAIILYYFGKSKIAFYVTVWHYAIYVTLLLFFINKYSATGAAIAFSLSEIITFLTLTAYVILKFKK
ncbi:MAG: oligosaccharide flippase family protein [Candidatus Curtissbacteria bacterium]|nr:oligosaccharide flippase family protein [Candidatus Curtissbacteria bacterium]